MAALAPRNVTAALLLLNLAVAVAPPSMRRLAPSLAMTEPTPPPSVTHRLAPLVRSQLANAVLPSTVADWSAPFRLPACADGRQAGNRLAIVTARARPRIRPGLPRIRKTGRQGRRVPCCRGNRGMNAARKLTTRFDRTRSSHE
ncbi:hypothetical protein A9974_25780 [Achromobacter sp. UMC71]|nr:hypothetical protein [Achromobacter sp. UMC71]